jgi:uncharacterized protein (TIGR00296 family)
LPFQLNREEGETLVRLARLAVASHLRTGKYIEVPERIEKKLLEKCGVFVTINSFENAKKELRGCIGLPYPTTPLAQAVIEAAVSAATEDPRFPKLREKELDNVTFELSILTPPELVETKNPTEYLRKIKVGQDGLIIERGIFKGLLLPQVPVEWEWNCEEFLCQCCIKAGLPPDNWLVKGTKIYKFQAIIFEEEKPRGEIRRKTLYGN